MSDWHVVTIPFDLNLGQRHFTYFWYVEVDPNCQSRPYTPYEYGPFDSEDDARAKLIALELIS